MVVRALIGARGIFVTSVKSFARQGFCGLPEHSELIFPERVALDTFQDNEHLHLNNLHITRISSTGALTVLTEEMKAWMEQNFPFEACEEGRNE